MPVESDDLEDASKLPKIKFCHNCHRRVANPFAKMNIKVGGGKLVSTCGCKAQIVWKEKSTVPQEPVPDAVHCGEVAK